MSVRLLGPPSISVNGEPIRTGLRRKARELLAALLLHPDGLTVDAAVDILWPDADPTRGVERFRTVVGNLRSNDCAQPRNNDTTTGGPGAAPNSPRPGQSMEVL